MDEAEQHHHQAEHREDGDDDGDDVERVGGGPSGRVSARLRRVAVHRAAVRSSVCRRRSPMSVDGELRADRPAGEQVGGDLARKSSPRAG